MGTVWDYNDEVRVLAGKHQGKTGKLKHCREESRTNMRAEVEIPEGRIWCDLDDLELVTPKPPEPPSVNPFTGEPNEEPEGNLIRLLLMLPEEEHAAFYEMERNYKQGGS